MSSKIPNDDEIVADLLAEKPTPEDGVDCVIVVDNVPKVPQEKEDKLLKVLKKIFSSHGEIRDDGLFLPRDTSTGLTKGFVFVEFANAQQAYQALKKIHGFQLDKQHVFEACSLADFERFEKVTDVYQPPNPEEYSERENLKSWLQNERCIDQYAIRHDIHTEIFANSKNEPERVHYRPHWTETYVSWSPLGTYLATFHKQGIALWGGPSWSKIVRFQHPGVKLIAWSPQEKYLVTWSNEVPEDPNDPQSIIIWDVRSGQKLRGFAGGNNVLWPVFKWSHDDKYVARLSEDAISVYATPGMGLLDKKSIKVNGVKDFAWSPTDNLLAYWVAESGNNPARVVILSIPTREEKAVKNLFSVNDCKLHWQQSGDRLAVKVDRHTKTKKSTFVNFEIFRIREKGVPVDVLELKENIVSFSWEPVGSKFAVIFGEGSKLGVSFYEVGEASKGGKIVLLKTLEKKAVNHLFWSPAGQFIVLAALRDMNNVLEFWDTRDMTCLNVGEHLMATDVEWDPTGRYVVTSVSYWRQTMENGYNIWSFTGRLLYRKNMEKFYQFLWRPRPATLLTAEQIKHIKKTMKEFSVKFDRQDALEASKASKEVLERRRALVSEYERYRQDKQRDVEAVASLRRALRPEITPDEFEDAEEIVEVFLNETIEPLDSLKDSKK